MGLTCSQLLSAVNSNLTREEVLFEHHGTSIPLSEDIEYIVEKINKKIIELNYVIDFDKFETHSNPTEIIINASELKTSFELLKENCTNISNLLNQKYVDSDKTFNLTFNVRNTSDPSLEESIYITITGVLPLNLTNFLSKYEEQFIHSICNQRLSIHSTEKATSINNNVIVTINGIDITLKNMFSKNAGFDFSGISFTKYSSYIMDITIKNNKYNTYEIMLSNNVSLSTIIFYINENLRKSDFACEKYHDYIVNKYIMSGKIPNTNHINLVLTKHEDFRSEKDIFTLKFFDGIYDLEHKSLGNIVTFYYCTNGNCNDGKRCKNIINFGNKYIKSIMPKLFLKEKSDIILENNNMMPEIIKYIYEVLTKYSISFNISKINGITSVKYKITIDPISVIKTKKPMSIVVPSNLDLTSDIPTSLPSDKSISSVTDLLESFAPSGLRHRSIEDSEKIEK